MSRYLLTSLCLISLPAAAWCALDPETKKPYHLTIVLRVANNRQLTPVFTDRIQSELRDWFQGALGDMAAVEVVDNHPLLKEVEAKGLQGTSCRAFTEPLVRALGGEVVSDEDTSSGGARQEAVQTAG